MCNKNTLKFADTLFVQLQAGQATYQLPDDAIITNAVAVKGLLATYDTGAGQKGPNGQTLVDAVSFRSAYINFTDRQNNIKVAQYPLSAFALETSTGYPQEKIDLELSNITTTKCQVFFGDTTNITDDMYLMLSISYI